MSYASLANCNLRLPLAHQPVGWQRFPAPATTLACGTAVGGEPGFTLTASPMVFSPTKNALGFKNVLGTASRQGGLALRVTRRPSRLSSSRARSVATVRHARPDIETLPA